MDEYTKYKYMFYITNKKNIRKPFVIKFYHPKSHT